MSSVGGGGAPGTIRTCNLLIRSQMLYPLSYGRLSVQESSRRPPAAAPQGYQRLRTSSAQPVMPSTMTLTPASSAIQPDQVPKAWWVSLASTPS